MEKADSDVVGEGILKGIVCKEKTIITEIFSLNFRQKKADGIIFTTK